MTGGIASNTVMVKEPRVELPPASTAVAFTVVTPIGKAMPEGGMERTETPGKSSVAVTS